MCAERRLSNFTGRKRHFNFVLNNVNYAILQNWLSLQNISRQNISHMFGGYLWRLNFSLCIFRPLKEKYNFKKPLLTFLDYITVINTFNILCDQYNTFCRYQNSRILTKKSKVLAKIKINIQRAARNSVSFRLSESTIPRQDFLQTIFLAEGFRIFWIMLDTPPPLKNTFFLYFHYALLSMTSPTSPW